LAAYKVGRQIRQLFVPATRETIFDGYALPLNISLFSKPTAKCSHLIRRIIGRPCMQKANHRQRRLLRVRRERPSGCGTAE
jgi:hypothetical protein